jgi:hypothetical protein
MEHERDRTEYRARLLEALTVSTRRSACGASDPIQVFINERRVGLLDGGRVEATLQVESPERIDTVQLRSEDGVLLGGLSAPEYGFRTSRIARLRDTVELRVHNSAQGGSISAVFIPAPSRWRQAWQTLAGVAGAAGRRPASTVVPGMRAVAFTQVLLACVVVGLAADRTTGWMTSERTPAPVTPAEAPWAAQLADVAKLEQQLVTLAQMQAKAVDTIQTQQQSMAQLQQAMVKLSSTQDAVVSGVLTVRREVEKRQKGSGREVERMARMLMSKSQTEQEELEAEIHSLTVANDKLSKELSQLEQNNQDLKKRLKSAGVDVSKASTPEREKPVVAQQIDAGQSPQVAEVRPAGQPQPFLFWVTFSEGTSQESIDQWVREMRGHKKAVSEGWQEVEVGPPAVPADRFLEQIRQAKIVKAVRVSR